MFNIKTLAMATAVSAGFVFAMPSASQAMPQSVPAKVDTVKNDNIVNVRHKSKKWARYCRYNRDDWRCYHNRPYARYRYRTYEEPYYGYYRPYRPYRVPGIYLNID